MRSLRLAAFLVLLSVPAFAADMPNLVGTWIPVEHSGARVGPREGYPTSSTPVLSHDLKLAWKLVIDSQDGAAFSGNNIGPSGKAETLVVGGSFRLDGKRVRHCRPRRGGSTPGGGRAAIRWRSAGPTISRRPDRARLHRLQAAVRDLIGRLTLRNRDSSQSGVTQHRENSNAFACTCSSCWVGVSSTAFAADPANIIGTWVSRSYAEAYAGKSGGHLRTSDKACLHPGRRHGLDAMSSTGKRAPPSPARARARPARPAASWGVYPPGRQALRDRDRPRQPCG